MATKRVIITAEIHLNTFSRVPRASDPEQRLARARAEMMRIPRHRRADEDALAEARDRTRRVQQMVEASKTASTTERLETVARATEAFYRGDDDRPTSK